MTAMTEPVFAWKDEYSVKIRSIDEQHKKLVSLVNSLQHAMLTGQGATVLGKILDDLISYTKSHFATEERLLRTNLYPDYNAHKAEHEALTEKVMTLHRDFTSGKPVMTVKVLVFLKNWLVEHIQGTDRKYSAHLLSRGIS
jgi:hemerythrin